MMHQGAGSRRVAFLKDLLISMPSAFESHINVVRCYSTVEVSLHLSDQLICWNISRLWALVMIFLPCTY